MINVSLEFEWVRVQEQGQRQEQGLCHDFNSGRTGKVMSFAFIAAVATGPPASSSKPVEKSCPTLLREISILPEENAFSLQIRFRQAQPRDIYGIETETPSLTQASADMTESGVVLLIEATEPSPTAKRIVPG